MDATVIDHLPYTNVNADALSELFIIADHASNAIPTEFNGLGLSAKQLQEHIAVDIGSAEVARLMAAEMNCGAILCGTSRLVVDCNRFADDPTLIPEVSDGVTIPGNQALSAEARNQRLANYFEPYHGEMARQVQRRLDAGIIPAIVSIHSFTPEMDGLSRPWDVALLWDRDPRMAPKLIDHLRRDPTLTVGDNEPYSGVDPYGYALRTYNIEMGLPMAVFEIRQDLLETSKGIVYWADKLCTALRDVLSEKSIFRIAHY